MFIHILKVGYSVIANAAVILICIVISSYLLLNQWNGRERNYWDKLNDLQKISYSHMSPDDVNDLLKYTWDMSVAGWVYEEVLGFRESPRRSKFVNVNQFGIRENGSANFSFNPNEKIWVFGGSTTWGYGVADYETIPSYLERELKKSTINFGRGYYYSFQENLLLSTMLRQGWRPDIVAFVDGINERCQIEVYEREFKSLFKQAQNTYPQYPISGIFIPAIQIINKLFNHSGHIKNDLHKVACSQYGLDASLAKVVKLNLLERKYICKRYGLRCFTFIQPFAGIDIKANGLGQSAVDQLKRKKDELFPVWKEAGAIFIDAPLPNDNMTLLVDDVHYSSEANAQIAHRMALILR